MSTLQFIRAHTYRDGHTHTLQYNEMALLQHIVTSLSLNTKLLFILSLFVSLFWGFRGVVFSIFFYFFFSPFLGSVASLLHFVFVCGGVLR